MQDLSDIAGWRQSGNIPYMVLFPFLVFAALRFSYSPLLPPQFQMGGGGVFGGVRGMGGGGVLTGDRGGG